MICCKSSLTYTVEAIGSWHLSLKRLNLAEALQSLVCYLWLFNEWLHVHLKNWTLQFKLPYMLNYISCFIKICTMCLMCCVNTHIRILKLWLESMLPLLIYRIFPRGLFLYYYYYYYAVFNAPYVCQSMTKSQAQYWHTLYIAPKSTNKSRMHYDPETHKEENTLNRTCFNHQSQSKWMRSILQ